MEILLQLLLLAAGFFMLGKGADWFVEGAAGIAARLGIPPLVIGLTIVAMGTSAPEAAVSITAAMHGNADITIGNIVGSNILNVLVILGLASVITPLLVNQSTVRVDTPFMIGITGLLLFQGRDGVISLSDGFILCIVFAAYMFYLFWVAVKAQIPETDEIRDMSIGKAALLTAAGLAVIITGSNVTVGAATKIAVFAGMSQRFIGLTIVALGTSLPELFTSVSAARRGEADIAIGNIVGSNIFNILFVVGLSSLIIPVPFAEPFVRDMLISLAAGVLLLLCVIRDNRLHRWGGALLLLGYAAYFWSIV